MSQRYSIVVNGDNTITTTAVGVDNMTSMISDGILGPLTLGQNEYVDKKTLLTCAGSYLTAGLAAGSVVARKRAANGDEPIAKVFF